VKVLFMGTPDYASRILERLIAEPEMEIVAVYTQPDKPVGRKKVMTPPPVKTVALEQGIAVHQPERLRDDAEVAQLQQIECDFVIVAAYGQILPKAVLEHAPCINLHASILPQYRGASPIQQTLLNGDTETGVTAMLMDEGLDTGAILKIARMEVPGEMMVAELFDRLTDLAAALTVDVLRHFDDYPPVAQNDAEATHCKKITKADGEVAFGDAAELYNRYRAFTPWPGVFLSSGLKLKRMALETLEGSHQPGTILSVDADSAVVGCERGALRLYAVQPPSKKEMAVTDYLNGQRLGVADRLA
jgi:methionyl-tRNA formyltransferase